MEINDEFQIEVAYALPSEQAIVPLKVKVGTTVEMAIEQSGILKRFPDIDLKKNKVGIFTKRCKLTDQLKPENRIEIYRPLTADPKEIRRRKALKTNLKL